MKAIMSAGLLALALWPGAVAAQEKLARDASSTEVMAHIRAQGLDREGQDAAVSVLIQRFGSADRAELDALAGELVALIVAADYESSPEVSRSAGNARLALIFSSFRDSEDRGGGVPYEGAYDAMMRAYVERSESGKDIALELSGLARIDPSRAAGLVRDLYASGHREACVTAQSGEFPFDIEAGLRPNYTWELCRGATNLLTKRFWYWPVASRSFLGIGTYHGERWQAHYVAARPRPVVDAVYGCSPAHYAGLRKGDVLLTVNGRDAREDIPVTEFGEPGGEATVRRDRGEPGSEYVLRVERDGAVLEFAVVSVDRQEWRAADPAPSRGLRPVTGTPVEEGCPATPWWR